jgi:ABC-type uncharacterized transport system ATPase subunit
MCSHHGKEITNSLNGNRGIGDWTQIPKPENVWQRDLPGIHNILLALKRNSKWCFWLDQTKLTQKRPDYCNLIACWAFRKGYSKVSSPSGQKQWVEIGMVMLTKILPLVSLLG